MSDIPWFWPDESCSLSHFWDQQIQSPGFMFPHWTKLNIVLWQCYFFASMPFLGYIIAASTFYRLDIQCRLKMEWKLMSLWSPYPRDLVPEFCFMANLHAKLYRTSAVKHIHIATLKESTHLLLSYKICWRLLENCCNLLHSRVARLQNFWGKVISDISLAQNSPWVSLTCLTIVHQTEPKQTSGSRRKCRWQKRVCSTLWP